MKWNIVKNFYIQTRQHLTLSIITDGFGIFIRNFIKEAFACKLNKETPLRRSK